MHPILKYLLEHQSEMVADLAAVVKHESPSLDKGALDGLADRLAERFARVGATSERLPVPERGDHLRIRYGSGDGQVLVLMHRDTVFDIGDIARNPWREAGGRIYGPGVWDMKAGIVCFLWALAALRAAGWAPQRTVVGLVTSDEEIGSHTSRRLIEAEAARSAAALVLEPAMPDGAVKVWRKGTGEYTLKVIGRPAHAGADPRAGISATVELAHQILALNALNDYEQGTTVNVGVIGGGSKTNVVAAAAEARVDVRIMTLAEAERVDAAIRALQPVLPGARLEVTGGLNRPPLERKAAEPLLPVARAAAAELGLALKEGGTGGGSDGNFTAAFCPTLDGLGPTGHGMHTFEEYVNADTLPQRAALLALLLGRI